MLSNALLNQLASATSTNTQDICRPFVRPGCISCPNETPIPFDRGLLDTGAQGSNFISRCLYLRLPPQATVSTRPIDRIVRLGDARHLAIRKEVCLSVVFFDSTGTAHVHALWYSVLDNLSHDLIIGLIDLIGPYYDLFADAVFLSRQHSTRCTDVPQLDAITSAVQSLATQRTPKETLRIARSLYCHIGISASFVRVNATRYPCFCSTAPSLIAQSRVTFSSKYRRSTLSVPASLPPCPGSITIRRLVDPQTDWIGHSSGCSVF